MVLGIFAAVGAAGCAAHEGATTPREAVGESARVAPQSVFLQVDVERASGERIAGTDTQLDLMRPLRFSAEAADGSQVDVEIFAEPGVDERGGYRVSLEVREHDRSGRAMSWKPALSIADGKEAVASIDWAGDGRRLRVRVSDAPLEPSARVGTAPLSEAEPAPAPPSEGPGSADAPSDAAAAPTPP